MLYVCILQIMYRLQYVLGVDSRYIGILLWWEHSMLKQLLHLPIRLTT